MLARNTDGLPFLIFGSDDDCLYAVDANGAPVPGFPVATVSLDKAGARNAAWLAAQMLALADAEVAQRLVEARQDMQKAVRKAAEKIESAYSPQWNKD